MNTCTVPDTPKEKFSRSSCDCELCLKMHLSVLEWNTFTPTTAMQRRMMEVISKIEKQEVNSS